MKEKKPFNVEMSEMELLSQATFRFLREFRKIMMSDNIEYHKKLALIHKLEEDLEELK